jgi:polyribonucleotide nucleotidyltransferase
MSAEGLQSVHLMAFAEKQKGEKMEPNETFSTKLENNYRTYTMDLAGRPLKIEIGRVGKQANGCAFMHYGDTTVLCTATASKEPREGIDFFPLECRI